MPDEQQQRAELVRQQNLARKLPKSTYTSQPEEEYQDPPLAQRAFRYSSPNSDSKKKKGQAGTRITKKAGKLWLTFSCLGCLAWVGFIGLMVMAVIAVVATTGDAIQGAAKGLLDGLIGGIAPLGLF